MQIFWFVVSGVLSVSAFELGGKDGRVNSENGWYVPLEDGSLKWFDMEEIKSNLEAKKSIFQNVINPVKLVLYTNSTPDNGEEITAESNTIANFSNNCSSFAIFIHGWKQNIYTRMNKEMRDAFFSVGYCNFVFVEWKRALLDYLSAVLAVNGVAQYLAKSIDSLIKDQGVLMHNIVVVGHSLGAQIAGYTGKNVKYGPLFKIIGLDPARPLFDIRTPEERLNSTDALYVECVQTNGGELGFKEPIGHVTFYPNGGLHQPGCIIDPAGLCSHQRSVTYLAESMHTNKFCSKECENYKDALANKCGSVLTNVRLGAEENARMPGGVFYVPINENPPYGSSC